MLNYSCSLYFIIKKMPKENKAKKRWGKFLDYVTSWDQYGVQVGLTLNGESHYKTIYGAIATFALGIYMTRIMYISMMPVFNK